MFIFLHHRCPLNLKISAYYTNRWSEYNYLLAPIVARIKEVLTIKLFVIGNGFDIDHHVKSEYWRFKEFLEKNFGTVSYMPYPCITQMPDGDEKSDLKTDAHIMYRLIEDIAPKSDWSTFEEDLGELQYDTLVDLSQNDDDDDIYRQIHNNEDLAAAYATSFKSFSLLFSRWAKDIDISNIVAMEKYTNVFSDDCLFLTFNYTNVLEALYGIPRNRICHVHGEIGETLIFGHHNKDKPIDDDLMYGNANIVFDRMHQSLYKDTRQCIMNHLNFFKKIAEVDEIYFLGWKMSEVDEEYLECISKTLNGKGISVHFTKYDEKKKTIKEKTDKLQKYKINFALANNI